MRVSSVTLEEVLAAAAARAASLVPETSGYLALAVGDATSRLPFRVEDRSVTLTTEGSVVVSRGSEAVPPHEAAGVPPDMLSRQLARSVAPCPPVRRRRTRDSERDTEAVVGELEAALIPVTAAARARWRAWRETLKAKESGRCGGAPRERQRVRPRRPRVRAGRAPRRALRRSSPALPAPALVPAKRPCAKSERGAAAARRGSRGRRDVRRHAAARGGRARGTNARSAGARTPAPAQVAPTPWLRARWTCRRRGRAHAHATPLAGRRRGLAEPSVPILLVAARPAGRDADDAGARWNGRGRELEAPPPRPRRTSRSSGAPRRRRDVELHCTATPAAAAPW